MFKKISITLFLAFVMAATGCKTAKKSDADSLTGSSGTAASEDGGFGDSDSGRAMGIMTVTFPYDSSTLSEEAKSTLAKNAQIMKDKASIKVQIEGHCDSRGGIQYNLALGEKRANAVRSYLRERGVAANRMTTISYGKERLMAAGDSEDAHAKNRRANFVITKK
jgi:peptidoglycan-associated lipoprotein